MLHIIVYCILKGLIPQSHTQLSARKHVSLAGKFFLHCFWPNATQISRKWGHVLARFGHLCQIANHTLNAHTWEYWRRTMATTKTNTPWPMTKMWYHIKGCKCAICSTISLIKKIQVHLKMHQALANFFCPIWMALKAPVACFSPASCSSNHKLCLKINFAWEIWTE